MVLNVDKTKCMVMGTQQTQFKFNDHVLKIQISGTMIHNLEAEKLLGIQIHQSFVVIYTYIDSVCKTLTYKILIFHKIKIFFE